MSDAYYDRRHLPAFPQIGEGQPELARLFFGYYGAVFAPGALGARTKALAALAVAHVVQCPYCIDAYTSGSLEKGADLEQLTEAIHIGALTRATSTLSYGQQAMAQAAALELDRATVSPSYFDRGHVEEPRTSGSPGLDDLADAWRISVESEDGALEPEDKAAIGVACAHALQCPYSIHRSTRRAVSIGLGQDALTEAAHVATAIRGGASLVHGLQMMDEARRLT